MTLRQGQNHIGKDYRGQVLSVDAPGFRFAIESMPAKKYPDLASQIKYAHLNLKFDEAAFPSFSDGFLAQLAGVRRLDREAKVITLTLTLTRTRTRTLTLTPTLTLTLTRPSTA